MKMHPVPLRRLPVFPRKEPLPAVHEAPVRRGCYFPRHHARVIEQGNLFVVEFMERPEHAAAPRRAGAPKTAVLWAVGQVVLLWGAALTTLTLSLMHLSR